MYCTIGTAGHVDHGKSTLVKTLTGVDTDRLKEEKARGLSIELGFAHMELRATAPHSGTDKCDLSFVDVPGHERFLTMMLSGITGIDAVLFCVAADDSIMPQTIEHLDIVNLLGFRKALFVLTKADVVTAEKLSSSRDDLKALLKGTHFENSVIVEASAVTGLGIEDIKDELFTICLDANSRKREESSAYFRLPIDRVFSIKGHGAVVTGTVASGSLKAGSEAALFPRVAGRGPVTVRSLESRHHKVESVNAGERAAVNIRGLSHKNIRKGEVLIDSRIAESFTDGSPNYFECAFRLSLRLERELKDGVSLKLHHQSSSGLATIRFLSKKSARAGERFYGRIASREPFLMMRGDSFILRETARGAVVGGGRVLAARGAGAKVQMPQKVSEVDYALLDIGDLAGRLAALTSPRGVAIESALLCFMLNYDEDALKAEGEGTVRTGGFISTAVRLQSFKDLLIGTLSDYSMANPALPGMEEALLRLALREEFVFEDDFFEALTSSLIDEELITLSGTSFSLKDYRPELKGTDLVISEAIFARFGDGLSVVTREELMALDFPLGDIDRVIGFCRSNETLVRLRGERYMTADAIRVAKEKLIEAVKSRGKIKASDYRDALGCGRKLAIEILEYFDGVKVTLRQGDYRSLR